MFEQTNQTETEAAMETAFSGEAFESGMGLVQESAPAAENEPTAESATAPQAEEKYTVKYNGKEVELSLDELKTRAQMGMNYDHVKAENDRIKNSQLYKTLRSLAQKEGVSLEEYGRRMEAQERGARLVQLQAEGMQSAAAKQFVEMEARLAAKEQETAENAPYLDFVRKFPDVTAQQISPQVWARFHETGDLIGAYTENENAQLRAQISAMEQNRKNAQRAIGSLTNDRAPAHTDAFLEGLLGG